MLKGFEATRIMKVVHFIMFAASLAFLCNCATQQDIVTLENRISSVEQGKVASAERGEYFESILEEKERNLRSQSARLHVALDELREAIQILTGRLEETEYLLKRRIQVLEDSNANEENRLNRLDEAIILNKDRIKDLEKYLDLDAPESDPGIKTANEPPKDLSEEAIYTMAKQEFDQNNLETARGLFQTLLNRYPESQHADNAQFWIGESYYREKWYEKAILEYQKVIEKYPQGNKMQASLLKQGLAFLNLENKTNARLILKELVKKYPQSNEAKIANEKLKNL
jgi:tol-pal system protein YbgF